MFDSLQSPQSQSKTAVTLLAVGLVFCPAVLLLNRGAGYALLTVALVISALCLGAAWASWRRYLSLVTPPRAVVAVRRSM